MADVTWLASAAFHPLKSATGLKSADKTTRLPYNVLASRKRGEIPVKVEIKLSAEVTEAYAVIHTNEITAEIRRIASAIEDRANSGLLTVTDNERMIVLRPEEIYMVRVEDEKTVVYTKAKKYSSNKRLYELENLLGSGFMRISKSVLVNLQYLDCVEPSFGAAMLLVLKNGCKDYISRKYLPAFKKYLGI